MLQMWLLLKISLIKEGEKKEENSVFDDDFTKRIIFQFNKIEEEISSKKKCSLYKNIIKLNSYQNHNCSWEKEKERKKIQFSAENKTSMVFKN